MAILVFILVSFLFGCAQGDDIGESVHYASTMFWPAQPEELADVEDMVDRLQNATGRDDIGIDPAGIRIELQDEVVVAGGEACAGTFARADGSLTFIQVRRPAPPPGKYCMDRASTMLHEAIHALAPHSLHSTSGVYRDRANRDTRLDAASLEALCSDFACTSFNPEE
jgi:hypothetical protein